MTHSDTICLGDEVRAALDAHRPVVALESAVLTHGLPAPINIEAAGAMDRAVREAGATPAICLIEGGHLWVGASLDLAEAVANHPAREKASIRDMGGALASGIPAGLTVSATLLAAHLLGIRVFATGGIGGVHVGATDTGDVSADLLQLGRFPVITVCSGAKSVLDIPRTLEFLETAGVPVFSYQVPNFPAFYLRSSGVVTAVRHRPEDIAEAARRQWELGYHAGVVVGHAIAEDEAIAPALWQEWLQQAEEAARRDRIGGKAVTPYLLDQVARLSEGRTVRANIALLAANSRLAAEIAVALQS